MFTPEDSSLSLRLPSRSVVQLETMQIGALERGMQIGASMHIGALREASTGIKDRL